MAALTHYSLAGTCGKLQEYHRAGQSFLFPGPVLRLALDELPQSRPAQDRRPAPGPSKRSKREHILRVLQDAKGGDRRATWRRGAPRPPTHDVAYRLENSASRGSRRDRMPPSLWNTPQHSHREE